MNYYNFNIYIEQCYRQNMTPRMSVISEMHVSYMAKGFSHVLSHWSLILGPHPLPWVSVLHFGYFYC